MFLNDFRQQGSDKIAKVSDLLQKEFGIKLTNGFPSKSKLERIVSLSETAIDKVKDSSTKFQHNPDYVKFLGLKDVANTMLNEGQYAKSPKHNEMKETLYASVRELMDSGYTMDEASKECMNRFRQDSRFAYDDEHVLPIVITAAQEYMDEGEIGTLAGGIAGYKGGAAAGAKIGGSIGGVPGATIGAGLGAVAGGILGDKLTDSVTLEAEIQEALNNGDTEGARTLMTQLREKKAKPDFLDIDKDGNKKEPMKKAAKDAKKNESMFDDILNDMLAEEIAGTSVEEAEVVMAVRALADDLQGHVERLGRMKNEDIPAIADQMKNEFGADTASQFKQNAEQLLDGSLASAKAGKDGIDGLIDGIGGNGGSGLTEPTLPEPDMDDSFAEPETSLDDMAMDDNEPASAGPEDEPLGRAPVEL
jgi:hypothetical protein|tara:strand:+ start:5602 stop:6858 length:1257 start_codon:yes stop_codon:yes gene_type:complete